MHYSAHLFHIELAVSPPAHTHGVHVERRWQETGDVNNINESDYSPSGIGVYWKLPKNQVTERHCLKSLIFPGVSHDSFKCTRLLSWDAS